MAEGIKKNPRPNKPRITDKESRNSKFLMSPIIKARIKIPIKILRKPGQKGSDPEVSDSSGLPQFRQANASLGLACRQ